MPCYSLLGLEICIPSLEELYNLVVNPLTGLVTDAINGLVSTLSPFFQIVIDTLSPFFDGVINALTAFLKDPLGSLQKLAGETWAVLSGLWIDISGAFTGLWDSVSGGLNWLGSQVSAGLESLLNSISGGLSGLGSYLSSVLNDARITLQNGINWVGGQLSGAIASAQDVLMTAFDGMGNAISGIMGGIFSGFGSVNINEVIGAASMVMGYAEAAIVSTLLHHSPIEPDEAVESVKSFIDQVSAAATALHAANLAAEGFSLGQVDVTLSEAWRYPNTAAAMNVATEFASMPLLEGLGPAFKRYILKSYQPNIPPYADLIRIYVKEGYLESHWVELPQEMLSNFTELGYNAYWTKRLWGMHWEYPSPTQLFEMLHRTAGNFPEIGVTDKVLSEMLKLHDYEPFWRGPLSAISWHTWRIYDIRTGWEMDLLTEEGLLKRLIDTGYEPKDAALLAEVQKMFVLRSEIDKLLTESDQDYIEGWISEEQLKLDYAATPYRGSVIALRVSRARLRKDREVKRDLKTALTDRFVKGDISETTFKEELSRLGITQDWIATEVERAAARKYKTVKEDTALESKGLTEAKYSRAFKVGLITEADYRANLSALKYSSEDIGLLVELNTPEKPAPEELPTLTLGELKAAFRVGVLTENELAAELDFRGYSPEDIRVIIDTEKTKIKPKTVE